MQWHPSHSRSTCTPGSLPRNPSPTVLESEGEENCFTRNPRTALAPTPTWKAVPRADIPGHCLYGCAVGMLETGAQSVPVNWLTPATNWQGESWLSHSWTSEAYLADKTSVLVIQSDPWKRLWKFILGKTTPIQHPQEAATADSCGWRTELIMSITDLKVWKKRPIQSSFCTFKNTILFIFVYEKNGYTVIFIYILILETELRNTDVQCRKNTVIKALLRTEEKRRHEQWFAFSLKSSTLEKNQLH